MLQRLPVPARPAGVTEWGAGGVGEEEIEDAWRRVQLVADTVTAQKFGWPWAAPSHPSASASAFASSAPCTECPDSSSRRDRSGKSLQPGTLGGETVSSPRLPSFYRGTEVRDGALLGARGNGPYAVKDDAPVLDAFAEQWRASAQHEDVAVFCRTILAHADFWGEDLAALPDLREDVSAHLGRILKRGVRQALGIATLVEMTMRHLFCESLAKSGKFGQNGAVVKIM